MGMEYSAICTELQAVSCLFKRIQLKPQESAEAYGRILLSKPEVIAQLGQGTRNFHHRALRLRSSIGSRPRPKRARRATPACRFM